MTSVRDFEWDDLSSYISDPSSLIEVDINSGAFQNLLLYPGVDADEIVANLR